MNEVNLKSFLPWLDIEEKWSYEGVRGGFKNAILDGCSTVG